MYKNKNGARNNICGLKIRELRLQMQPVCSQRKLADMLQLSGVDLDKNAIQRMEAGNRYITDIELKAFAELFNVDISELYK